MQQFSRPADTSTKHAFRARGPSFSQIQTIASALARQRIYTQSTTSAFACEFRTLSKHTASWRRIDIIQLGDRKSYGLTGAYFGAVAAGPGGKLIGAAKDRKIGGKRSLETMPPQSNVRSV